MLKNDSSCCFIQEIPSLSNRLTTPMNLIDKQSKQCFVSTLFIYHKGETYPGARLIPGRVLRMPFTKLSGYHEYRRSPRSFPYMRDLIASTIGNIEHVAVHDMAIVSQVSKFEQIILLWPDGNGMGWFDIERQIFKEKRADARVYVLNGRRRLFELPRKQWRAFRLKRFLEKTFLLELGILLVFIVTAPFLALWDGIIDGMQRDV